MIFTDLFINFNFFLQSLDYMRIKLLITFVFFDRFSLLYFEQ